MSEAASAGAAPAGAAPGPHAVASVAALEALYPSPSAAVRLKVMDHLDAGLQAALARSPLAFLATCGADGQLDCSPRGDAVTDGGGAAAHVLDAHTLLLPDRPGNNRVDSLRNIVQTGAAGLIFLLPGIDEVVRVNGSAHVSTDPALLERLSLGGKPPRSVIVVRVREAFMHCPRAFGTAQLWNPERHLKAEQRPDLMAMFRGHVAHNTAKLSGTAED